MCGRFSLFSSGDVLARRFGLVEVPVYAPRYNIAPTSKVVVVQDGSAGGVEGAVAAWMHWGIKIRGGQQDGSRLVINARSEGVDGKPLFREAYRSRRCLVPADGFFEWSATPAGKQPYWFSLKEDGPMALAGIWSPRVEDETHRGDEGVEAMARPGAETGAGDGGNRALEVAGDVVVLTTRSNPLVARVHDRMPVILDSKAQGLWLDPEAAVDRLSPLLVPFSVDRMEVRRVSKRVNDAGAEGPVLVAPDEQQSLF